MRRTRFRRRRSGVWLPVYGNAVGSTTTDFAQGVVGNVPLAGDGSITFDAVPVTFDYTESAWANQTSQGTQTLHDIVSGQEWRLRRIVGKCHNGVYFRLPEGVGNIPLDTPPAWEVAAGYIVLKTDEEGDPLTDLAECNPLIQESADDPWIWRRKWLYRAAGANNMAGSAGNVFYDINMASKDFPTSNVQALGGGVLDGPHIDQKTARVIRRQERLFFIIAARQWNPGVANAWVPGIPVQLWYNVDHRFFGGLQFSRGNRNNSSR